MLSLYRLLLPAGVEKQRETSSTVTTTLAFSRPGIYVATLNSRELALSRTDV